MRKAVILSAGLGTRLRPLTDTCPKPMIPVAGMPLLERTARHLKAQGISQMFINLHHLPQVAKEHFGQGQSLGLTLCFSEEKQLLGTAGALNAFRQELLETFVVWYGDVLSNLDVQAMHAFHQAKAGICTVALHRVENPTQCGLVDLDKNGRITRFVEKPAQAFTDLANAGVYICQPEVLNFIPISGFSDFGQEVFPAMLAAGVPMYGYPIQERLIDIGSPEKLALANREWAQYGS